MQNIKEGLENLNENIRDKVETIEETYERFSTDCVHKCNSRSKRKSNFHHQNEQNIHFLENSFSFSGKSVDKNLVIIPFLANCILTGFSFSLKGVLYITSEVDSKSPIKAPI